MAGQEFMESGCVADCALLQVELTADASVSCCAEEDACANRGPSGGGAVLVMVMSVLVVQLWAGHL